MDLYELKIRSQQLVSELRALSWKDPDQRKVLVLLAGGGVLALLVPIAAGVLLVPAVTTSQAERAAEMNEDTRPAVTTLSSLERVRDELSPRLRQDDRFAAVLIRPGTSAEAPDAVATLQGSVIDRAAFEALVALLDAYELAEAVHVRVSIEPARPQPAPDG